MKSSATPAGALGTTVNAVRQGRQLREQRMAEVLVGVVQQLRRALAGQDVDRDPVVDVGGSDVDLEVRACPHRPRPGCRRPGRPAPRSSSVAWPVSVRQGPLPRQEESSERADTLGFMCGRYASSARHEDLAEDFQVDDLFDGLPGPDYNVAPTVAVPAIFERKVKDTGEVRRRLAPLVWGLVPSWAKDVVHRIPDDQRPAGDRRGEARLPQGVRGPPLPAAGRRLLRVVHPGDRRRRRPDAARASRRSSRSSSTAPTAGCW